MWIVEGKALKKAVPIVLPNSKYIIQEPDLKGFYLSLVENLLPDCELQDKGNHNEELSVDDHCVPIETPRGLLFYKYVAK